MRTVSPSTYPEAAVSWMLAGEDRLVLDVGSGNGRFAVMMAGLGHRVRCVDSDVDRVRRLVQRVPGGMHCVARAESLPMRSYRFDVVTVQESFTRFAPGLALAEFARVLKPGGHLGVVFTSRDDTVPWVKRLARRIQQDDPTAMLGDYGRDTIAALEDSAYFPRIEERTFRNWVPIDRDDLLNMVRRRRAIARLPKARLESLEADLRAIFDSSARAREPLMLPFQAVCRRAWVDHSDLTQPLESEGLRISMRF
jgi:SAM-dependent methyltransferase